ncbi:MAG: hypothetical protein AAB558_03050 [Patescibacteria group bacterium]
MKKKIVLVIAILLIILLSVMAYSQIFVPVRSLFCIGCDGPRLKFNHPENNVFVSGVAVLDAGINNGDFNTNTISYLAFEYFDGQNWQVIEDLTGNKFIRNWDIQWDIDFLPSGPLPVRIVLRNTEGKEWSARLTLNINEAPVNDFVVSNDGRSTVLDGSNSFDPDGFIESYSWLVDTDQPFRVEGEIAFVPIDDIPIGAEFGLSLTTIDNHGGGTTTHTLLTLPCRRCDFQERPKSCGCEKMDVIDAGLTRHGQEMWWMPEDQNRNLGEYDDINMSKPSPFKIVHNFQVIADLFPNSDQNKCFEGQRVKVSYTIEGIVRDWNGVESILNDNNSFSKGQIILCPFGGPRWCDDGYNEVFEGKQHVDQNRIVWIDGPGYHVFDEDDIAPPILDFLANFEARVSGSDGSCQCNWDVNITVLPDGNVLRNRLFNKRCTP